MSTITKLNYLADTKDELKDKLNEHGANITDNDTFRSYVDKIKGIYNNWPKVTGEGTEITLTPTRKGKMNIGLKGNTSQDSTTGKNLLDTSLLPITAYGLTISKDANGNIIINGTPNYSSGYKSFTIGQQKTIDAGTYTTSLANKKVGLGINVGGFSGYLNITMSDTVTSKTVTSNETYTIQGIINIRYDAGTFDNYIFNPMLELGSTATDYEPFTNGASPNPDYPQPIHIVTGNNTISIGDTNYPINLGSLEFCKIENYQDEIFKNEPNNPHYDSSLVEGGWYKNKAITKIILDGTENWKKSGVYNGSYYIDKGTSSKFYVVTVYSPLFCNRFIRANINYGAQISNYKQGTCFIENTDGNFDVWYDDGTSTLEDFRSWLTANNLVVYCVLKAPSTTQITDENLISQLNAIENAMSTTGTTTITQTNADLPFIISASALKKGGN